MIERRIKKRTEDGFRYLETEWYLKIKKENEKFINRISVTTALFGLMFSIILMLNNVIFEDGKLILNFIISSVVMLGIIAVILKVKNINFKSNLIIVVTILSFIATQILPGAKELDMLIFIIFPIIAIQIEGVRRGSIWVFIFWNFWFRCKPRYTISI